MKILENEIASTSPFGELDGKPVKMIKTKGGLVLATNSDGAVLSAASHQAILAHTLEQKYKNYQPLMMKSEGSNPKAESHSHFLSDDLRKSGHDIYSIQENDSIDFYITKQDIKIGSANGSIKDNYLSIGSLNVPKEAVKATISAVSEKALSIGLKNVKVEAK